MADFFGHSQFGGHYFRSPDQAQGQPNPSFNPGFEKIVPSGVVFSMGANAKKGYTTAVTFPVGPVEFHNGIRRKRS